MNAPMAAPTGTRRPSTRQANAIAQQRGAALLTAMIIVTLVSTLAAAMVWQQWRAVQVESAERDRTQAAWTLSSALQFASLVLRESGNANNRMYTALTDFWATPLAEGRVSTLNGTDKSTDADDDSQGFLSGSIEDAQARYNLLNLITPGPSNGGPTAPKYTEDPQQLAILVALCQSAKVDASVASRIATGLVGAANGSAAGAPLVPETVDQLVWLDLDQASIDALRPYVVLLNDPKKPIGKTLNPQPVNANTASAPVLSAILGIVDASLAQKIVQLRQKAPFKNLVELKTALTSGGQNVDQLLGSSIGVQSSYFEVRGRLRLSDRVLSQQSLVYRDPTTQRVTALRSERVSSIERVAP